ncbi:NADPH:quinone reductase-like Zn-dependent oxidoreductase [Rhodopirellula rubra]|uniref:NADPH:quinone reductase-like Zn-dependent oxidoreductase n=1 Tax=Aporhodopirellula rubra TaxID=980271 RepID=A0A7W5E3S7_9BACT|nr:NAD(P)-dependent alcohol dehydrogenase [Aporhodopirellula rubra]MBB3209583.1 NADPH:quinone reductase-like Zn-dependent oxidoreductase [Aporhodopirellula rubra]
MSPSVLAPQHVQPSGYRDNEFSRAEHPTRQSKEQTMKAVYQEKYGSPDDLRVTDIAKPQIKEDEVLVRVHAAGLHVGDSFGVRGTPLLMRVATGLFKPKYGVPGFDVAGTVEATGKKVTRFQTGDEVFGTCFGSCAEFVAVNESTLAAKPANVSFLDAAAMPTSGLAALHALRDVAKLQSGQHLLVNGASGGVGSFAVQIAKTYGAVVTGVCSEANSHTVRALGADHVIAYDREDFTLGEPHYDVIFDNIENRSLSDCRRVLKPNGMLILNSGTGAKGLAMFVRLIKPLLLSPMIKQNLRRYLSVPNRDDLNALMTFVEAAQVRPLIDRTYTLSETPDAIGHIETGHVKGKVVVRVLDASSPQTQNEPNS